MDENIDLLNHDVFEGCASGDDLQISCSIDNFFNDIFDENQYHICTHAHTCNPPGPDLTHTHTCLHVHTKIHSAPSNDEVPDSTETMSKKRHGGNKEAVRKYRQKKKARVASLEDVAVHLRAVNQQLMKRLKSHSALEAEVARLKCLLVDLRGRIDGEIGSFPYQKPMKGINVDLVPGMPLPEANMISGVQVMSSTGFSCNDQIHCIYAGIGEKDIGENRPGQAFDRCNKISNAQMQFGGTTSISGSHEETLGCRDVTGVTVDCSSILRNIEGSDVSARKLDTNKSA